MFKDGIDYLVGFAHHWKLLLSSFILLWTLLLVGLSQLPEEQRVMTVVRVGSQANVDNEPEIIEELEAASFRIRNVMLPTLLATSEFAGKNLGSKQIGFTEQEPDLLVIDARSGAAERPDVVLLLKRLGNMFTEDHRQRYEAHQALLQEDLRDTESLIEEIENRQGQADGLLSNEQSNAVVHDGQSEDAREFLTWSKTIYGVQASSSLTSQYRLSITHRNRLRRALSLNTMSAVTLPPTTDQSKSYKPGILLGVILSGLIAGIFAVLLVGMRMLFALVKDREAQANGPA